MEKLNNYSNGLYSILQSSFQYSLYVFDVFLFQDLIHEKFNEKILFKSCYLQIEIQKVLFHKKQIKSIMDSHSLKYFQNINQTQSYKSCQEEDLNDQKHYIKRQTSEKNQILGEKKKTQEQELYQALFYFKKEQNYAEDNDESKKQSPSLNQNCKIEEDQYKTLYLTKTKSQQVQIKLKKQKKEQCEGKRKKNFLTIVKRCIIRLYYDQLSLIEDEEIKKFIQEKAKSNRIQFQNLFKNEKARRFIADIFTDKKLERQIQLTRVDGGNRKLFLTQINKLRKCYCSKTFNYE